MMAVAVFLKLNKQLEVSFGNHAMCLLLEITIIFRDSDSQIFLNGDVLLNGSGTGMDGTLKRSHRRIVVVQGERHQRRLVIRIKKGCEGRIHWTCEQTVC